MSTEPADNTQYQESPLQFPYEVRDIYKITTGES